MNINLKRDKTELPDLEKYLKDLKQTMRYKTKENIANALKNNPFKEEGIFRDDLYKKYFWTFWNIKVPKKYLENNEFFSDKNRFFEEQEICYLKWVNQLVALDDTLNHYEKIDVLKKDLLDWLQEIKKLNLNKNLGEKDLILTIWIFSYIKNSVLTFFNAFISNEKLWIYNLDNWEYLKYRFILKTLLDEVIENYYNLILTWKLLKNTFSYEEKIEDLSKYLEKNTETKNFSRSELDDPLKILAFSYNVYLNNKDIDLIVWMPSWWTELAMCQKFLYKKLDNKNLNVLYLPVSLHSIKDLWWEFNWKFWRLNELSYEKAIFKWIKEKKIIVVDDNSSTGSTMDIVLKFLEQYSPKEVRCFTCEADIIRMQLNKDNPEKQYIASEKIFKHSVWLNPVSKNILPKFDLTEIYEIKKYIKFLKKEVKKYLESKDYVNYIKAKIKLDLFLNKIDKEKKQKDKNKEDLENSDNIISFKKTYLSNFYPVDIEFRWKIFPSVEHAYFYGRIDFDKLKKELKKDNWFYFSLIKDSLVFSLEKEEFFKNNEFCIDDLDKYFYNKKVRPNFLKRFLKEVEKYDFFYVVSNIWKYDLMIKLLLEKYKNEELRNKLLETGNKKLIEWNDWWDIYWWVDTRTFEWSNILWRALMEIRELLKENIL